MSIYEDVPIADMDFDPDREIFLYTCPCGDLFQISLDAMFDGEDIATCPSCSLLVRVIYEDEDLDQYCESDDESDEVESEERSSCGVGAEGNMPENDEQTVSRDNVRSTAGGESANDKGTRNSGEGRSADSNEDEEACKDVGDLWENNDNIIERQRIVKAETSAGKEAGVQNIPNNAEVTNSFPER